MAYSEEVRGSPLGIPAEGEGTLIVRNPIRWLPALHMLWLVRYSTLSQWLQYGPRSAHCLHKLDLGAGLQGHPTWAQSRSHIRLFATPWTVAHQAPLSTGFPRQEYWSGLPFPFPGDLPDPGIELVPPASLVLQADSLPFEPSEKPSHQNRVAERDKYCREKF